MSQSFAPGDPVVYHMTKRSTRPGPRAADVRPALHGEDYAYHVEKHWTVTAVRPNGQVEVCTRRGKRHVLRADDPALRPARWWERWFRGNRFPALG
jgi:hypothetical protein